MNTTVSTMPASVIHFWIFMISLKPQMPEKIVIPASTTKANTLPKKLLSPKTKPSLRMTVSDARTPSETSAISQPTKSR